MLEEDAVEHGEDDALLGFGEVAQALEPALRVDTNVTGSRRRPTS